MFLNIQFSIVETESLLQTKTTNEGFVASAPGHCPTHGRLAPVARAREENTAALTKAPDPR